MRTGVELQRTRHPPSLLTGTEAISGQCGSHCPGRAASTGTSKPERAARLGRPPPDSPLSSQGDATLLSCPTPSTVLAKALPALRAPETSTGLPTALTGSAPPPTRGQ